MNIFETASLNLAFNAGILLLSIILLWKGADGLVDSASRIAVTLGVSDLVIGLTIVAMGTSAPEFAVTINAALSGKADISVGNIVGSNIFNLGFILGIVAIIRNIEIGERLVYRDGFFMIGITILLLLFFRDLTLSRMEGSILIVLMATYLLLLFIRKEPLEEDFDRKPAEKSDYLVLPLGIVAVVAGGHFLVESSSFIARSAGISEWVIGVTIIAAGTSAPEMATSIAAVIKGRHGISAGNLIGSDIFNILGVLGLAAILKPLAIGPVAYPSLIMLSGMVFLVVLFMRTGWKITRAEGVILLTIGLVRWYLDFSH